LLTHPTSFAGAIAPPALPARRGLVWYADGLRLWRRAPLMLLLLALVSDLAEFALQLLPFPGFILSKMAVGMLGAGLMLGVDRLARGERLRPGCLLDGFRRGRLRSVVIVSVWMLVIPAIQVLVATAIHGRGALGVVVSGRPPVELLSKAFLLSLILPGLLPGTLLMLAVPFVLFDGLRPAAAVVRSVRTVLGAPLAFGSSMILTVALFIGGLLCKGLPLLLLGPWLLAMNYCAYRDVRTR
jgi:hypothetical protein